MEKKLSIPLLIMLVGFPQISETIYTPALPSVALGLNTSAHLAEATLAIYFLGFALGVALWGAVSDRTGRRFAMLAGIFTYAIATLACGNATTIESLLAWRFLQAFGASVGSVITQTILRDAYDGPARAKLFSLMAGVMAFSPALGPILGSYISEYFGWRANFFALTGMSVVLIAWAGWRLPETKPPGMQHLTFLQVKELFLKMISSKTLWGHILLIGATNGIIFSFCEEAPFVFIEQLGMQTSHFGFLGLLIAGGTLVGARVSYALNYSHETKIALGALVSTIGGMVFSLTAIFGIFTFESYGIILSFVSLFTIFFGVVLVIPNSLAFALKPYQSTIGTAGSIFGGLYYCLIAGFTWSMSLAHNGTSYVLPFFLLGLCFLLLVGSKIIRQAEVIEQKV